MGEIVNIKRYKIYSILIFIAIYFSHDTIMFGTTNSSTAIIIRKIVPFVLCGILFVLNKKIFFTVKTVILCSGLLFLPLISCFINGEDIQNYIYRFAIILAAILFVVGNEYILDNYNDVMAFLAVWSIVGFVISNLLPQIMAIFPKVVSYNGTIYSNMLFFLSPINGNSLYSFIRNRGIFREPGVYMIFLFFALLFEFFYKRKINKKRVIIFTITLLTTGSTAGIIILLATYVYVILMKKNFKYRGVVIVLVGIFCIILSNGLFESIVAGKFIRGSNSYGSFYSRYMSIFSNLEIAIKNPVFGIGRYSLYNTILFKDEIYLVTDNTNTIIIGIVAYGFLFGIICLYGLYKMICHHQSLIVGRIFELCIVVAALSNEDLGQNIIYYILVVFGIYVADDIWRKKQRNLECEQYS